MKKEIIKMLKKLLVVVIEIPLNIFIWCCVVQFVGGDVSLGIIFGCITAGMFTGVYWVDIDNERW